MYNSKNIAAANQLLKNIHSARRSTVYRFNPQEAQVRATAGKRELSSLNGKPDFWRSVYNVLNKRAYAAGR